MSKLLLAWVALLATLAPSAAPAAVPNPTVTGPIPNSQGVHGHPLWDSWFEVGSLGYTEGEYFIEGVARQPGSADTAPYRTRIIVTRPADPAKFNGTVLMDWVNVTAQFENAVDTQESHDYLLREGYAFVHVSAQKAGICCTPLTPKVWDPVRYGIPDASDPLPIPLPPTPNSVPGLHHPGDAYALDIFAQVAQALKSPSGVDPMGGLDVQHIVAAGQSQSAGKLDDYLHQWQDGAGERVIDAFLIHGRVANRAEQISARADEAASRVLQLNSDFEAYANAPGANPYYTQWDVAGAAHSSFWIGVHSELGGGPRFADSPQLPATADGDLHAGNAPYLTFDTWNYGEQISPGQPICILQGNQFPMHYAVNAALDAIRRWLVDGVQPPSGPRFQVDGGSLARDSYGNALGGIRLAPIEHPVASYRSADCALGGTTVPFTELQLLQLYPTHADYACQMRETTYQNVKDGFLLEEDALSLLSRVDGAVNRWPLDAGVADCDDDAIPDAQDNCPLVANTDQADRGGVNTQTADGVGDACQCGDVTGNGVVNGQDANAIKRHGLGATPNPTFREPGNCDATGNGRCNGQDANALRAVLIGRPLPMFGQNCQNADPYAPTCTDCGEADGSTTWRIEDGPNEKDLALYAFFSATSGDTIEFGEGAFEFDTTLVMAGNSGSPKDGVTIRGQGPRKTILDFLGSRTPEGLSFSHMEGLTVENLTVIDTPGFSLKVSDSNHVVIRNVRTMWSSADSNPLDAIDDRGGMDPKKPSTLDVSCVHELSFPVSTGKYVDASGLPRLYQTDAGNGGYAIYPVLSNDVLIDHAVALGASDAGIYVGQSNDVIVKNSEALFNVAGFEIENTDDADVFDNVAHCNTGGFLTFDLPGLNQYGEETRTFRNYAGYNNTVNFAPGGVVSDVPQGVGMLQLGYDEHEIFQNTIEWNRTVGLVFVGHPLLDGNTDNPDKRMDLYPDAVHVHHNTFTTNGTLPQPPELGVITCQEGTGPGFDSIPPCIPTGINDAHASLLPALIQIKGVLALQNGDTYGPTGAHITWDGGYEAEPNDCPANLVLDDDPDPDPEFEAILDDNGKPQYTGAHDPLCRYNAYKFTAGGERKAPAVLELHRPGHQRVQPGQPPLHELREHRSHGSAADRHRGARLHRALRHQPRIPRRGGGRAVRARRTGAAAAVARADRRDLRRLQREPDQPRSAPVQLPEALGLQPVRGSHRSAHGRERGRHALRADHAAVLGLRAQVPLRVPAAGPVGDLARGQRGRAERDAGLPGGHRDREDVRVPERCERRGRRDAPVDPPREERRWIVLGGDGVHLGQGRERKPHRRASRDRGRHRVGELELRGPGPRRVGDLRRQHEPIPDPARGAVRQLPRERRQGPGRLADRRQGAAAQPARGLRQRARESAPALGRRGHAQRSACARGGRERDRHQRAAPAALRRARRPREHPDLRARAARADDAHGDRSRAARAQLDRDQLRALPQPRRPRAEHGRVLRRVPAREPELRNLQDADHGR